MRPACITSHGTSADPAQMEERVRAFFSEIDSPEDSDAVVFHGSDVLVQTTMELPIPMRKGSIVDLTFSTLNGDISFSMQFASWLRPQLVEGGGGSAQMVAITEPTRVPSDTLTYSKTFKAPSDGSLVLLFDNTYSWFTTKSLNYHIELFEPRGEDAESARRSSCRSLLGRTAQENQRALSVLYESRGRSSILKSEVLAMEERAAAMRAELEFKGRQLDLAYEETDEMTARIQANQEKTSGLCIRLVITFRAPGFYTPKKLTPNIPSTLP